MSNQINVLIIEDDFWIAGIHKEMTEKVPLFHVTETATTSAEALDHLATTNQLPAVILLDIYIPDTEGLSLFHTLRSTYPTIDIIIISAANDQQTIVDTKRAGAFDYIIKPVDKSRLTLALSRYKEYYELIQHGSYFEQQDVDRLFNCQMVNSPKRKMPVDDLPKGIDPLTLQEVTKFLEDDHYKPMTATEISKSLGLSRSTIRRYMEYLVTIGHAEATLNYGSVGRPLRQYVYSKQNEQNK